MMEEYDNTPSESCKDCRFYMPHVYESFDAGYANLSVVDQGECRRLPPQVLKENQAFFPVVKEDDWCGEFDL